jgi:hypothetical protein
MLAWVKSGCKPATFPESQRGTDDWVSVVVVRPGGLVDVYERSPYPFRVEDETYATGSGRDYAIAAMHLGKSAAQAVEIASLFDPACGNGVDTLELK